MHVIVKICPESQLIIIIVEIYGVIYIVIMKGFISAYCIELNVLEEELGYCLETRRFIRKFLFELRTAVMIPTTASAVNNNADARSHYQ